MRKSVVVFLVLAYVSPAWAEQQAREKWLSICIDLSNIGGAVMRDRQKGVPKAAVVKAADGNRTVENLVDMAYMAEMPPTREGREAVIEVFEKEIYQKCELGSPF